MAHSCPNCFSYCTCKGDIDDIDMGVWDGCECCCECEDDDDDDDRDDPNDSRNL